VKFTIDTDARTVVVAHGASEQEHPLYSDEAFALLSRVWLKVGWNQKYTYGFPWMGRPIIQLPEDNGRNQGNIHRTKADVIVETGVAHGGSLVFYASLLRAMGRGRVIGVDIEIRPHNRRAIEMHDLASSITLIEGNSIDAEVVRQVRARILDGERVLVLLDSNHTKSHVAAELGAYAPLVSVGSYIVATDGIMEDVSDVPRGRPEWQADNPAAAAREFVESHPHFVLEAPPF